MAGARSVHVARGSRLELPVDSTADPRSSTPKIESEFRAWFYANQVQRAHVSLALAQVLVFTSIGFDLFRAEDLPERLAALFKLVLISPLLLATLWISRHPRWQRYYPHFMCASIAMVALVFSVINLGGTGLGVGVRYDALVLVTVFTYFLGGLAPTFASATGLALLGLHVYLSYSNGLPLTQLTYESLFLLALNAVGMLSANLSERAVREAFWRFQTMSQLSDTDPLTGLMNRRGFDRRYAELWEQAQREGKAVALAFIDLDNFKGVNDAHGHEAGDQALRAVATVLRGTLPEPAMAARLGGDELVAVWYDVAAFEAKQAAGSVPPAVEALGVRGEKGEALTVSVGLCVCQPSPVMLASDCLRRADRALYAAKEAGRNRLAVD